MDNLGHALRTLRLHAKPFSYVRSEDLWDDSLAKLSTANVLKRVSNRFFWEAVPRADAVTSDARDCRLVLRARLVQPGMNARAKRPLNAEVFFVMCETSVRKIKS